MHFVKERRDFLNLIDHDLLRAVCAVGVDFLAQQLRPCGVFSEIVVAQQVDPSAIRIGFFEQGALASLARPPEEERLGSSRRQMQ